MEAGGVPITRPWLGPAERDAVAAVLASGWVAQGPQAAAFEQAVCDHVGAAHGVAVSSGTAGLHLALVVAGIGSGDEVIVPSLSYIATANAPLAVGATPVFADVDPQTQNLTPDTIRSVITPRTRAVILVHQVGTPADIDAVHELCDPLGVAVVEDAACALGATYRGRAVGAHSDLVVFSFHPRKVITTGEGGMVMIANAEWAARLRRLRDQGASVSAWSRSSSSTAVEAYLESGFNYRLSDVLAAIGLVQLTKLDAIVAQRRAHAHAYQAALRDTPVQLMAADPRWGTTNYQSFWVELPDEVAATQDEVLAHMLERGVIARRGVMAAHREPAFAGTVSAPLPVTERLTRRTVLLPLFHEMTPVERDRVVAALLSAIDAAPVG
jgi:dTDP-4-amino-4,6-dideoxygalactose transaminase